MKVSMGDPVREQAHHEYWKNNGKTPMYLMVDGTLKGIICVADTIKETSVEAVDQLKSLGNHGVYADGRQSEGQQDYIGRQAHIDTVSQRFCRKTRPMWWSLCRSREKPL